MDRRPDDSGSSVRWWIVVILVLAFVAVVVIDSRSDQGCCGEPPEPRALAGSAAGLWTTGGGGLRLFPTLGSGSDVDTRRSTLVDAGFPDTGSITAAGPDAALIWALSGGRARRVSPSGVDEQVLTGLPSPRIDFAATKDAVWTANRGLSGVVRTRLGTGERTRVGIGKNVSGIVANGRSVWVVAEGPTYSQGGVRMAKGPGVLVELDSATAREVGRSAETGVMPAAEATGLGSVWVGNYAQASVTIIDAKTHRRQATIDCGGVKPRDIAVGPDGAWVIGYDEKVVVHIVRAAAGFRSEQKQMTAQPNAVTSWRGAVWMLDSEGALSRLSE